MNKRLILIIVAVAVVAMIIIAAITNSPHNRDIKSPTTNPNAAVVATSAVRLKGGKFVPQNITVRVGTTVTWTNNDSGFETVTGASGSGIHSDTLSKGGIYQFTFTKKGTFDYSSTETNMKGSVIVTD